MNQINKETINFTEEWSRWDLDGQADQGNYYISTFNYECIGFRIILKKENIKKDDTQQIVEILFPYEISALRIVDEGLRLKLYRALSEKYGDDFYQKWAFFTVEKSDYLKWLSNQSYEISDSPKTKHFVIKGLDCLLDIITRHQPKIRILD